MARDGGSFWAKQSPFAGGQKKIVLLNGGEGGGGWFFFFFFLFFCCGCKRERWVARQRAPGPWVSGAPSKAELPAFGFDPKPHGIFLVPLLFVGRGTNPWAFFG